MKRQMDLEAVKRILDHAVRQDASGTRERLLADRWSDTTDEAQWSEEAAVALGELDVAWTTRRQARAALERLRDGHYGECESCSRPIGAARLTALPWATRCVRCASIRERFGADGAGQPEGPPHRWLDPMSDAA